MFMQKYAVVLIYLFTYRSKKGFSHSKVNFVVNNDFCRMKLSSGYLRAHSKFMNWSVNVNIF